MFLKPYRIERRVPIGTTAQNVFSFSVNNFNPDSFEFIMTHLFSVSLFNVTQFTLSTPLIKPNFCVQLPHRRSTIVSLQTTPFIHLLMIPT